MRSGVGCALWYRFSQLNPEEADDFFYALSEGADLAKTDAIFVLRRNLIQDARRSFERMPDYREAAVIIKAWNAYREGKPLNNVAFKYGPTYKETFPPIL